MIKIIEDIGYIGDMLDDEEEVEKEEKHREGEEYLTIKGDVIVKCDEEAIGHIDIPNSVTSIEKFAFDYCDLESITIPDSVTVIGYMAFKGCELLKSVTIPDSVTSIGWYAFDGCKSLESIKCSKDSYADRYAKRNKIPVEYI